ncbi:MAG: hypothetical protein HY270_09640 [Deltaproteobacteria bacterium]|nr:hypothetical protein [Deltaproteobacteria bacterium]
MADGVMVMEGVSVGGALVAVDDDVRVTVGVRVEVGVPVRVAVNVG